MATFGLLDFKSVLRSNVDGKSAIGGAAIGVVGIGAVTYALNMIPVGGVPLLSKIPDSLKPFTPLLASAVAAFAGYALLGKNKKRANSFAVGSLAAGTTVTAYNFLKTKFPAAFADLQTFRLPGMNGMGYVVPNSDSTKLNGLASAHMGLLTPDTGSRKLNGLAQSAMGGMDDYVEYAVP